ncbi:hypothetical protein K3722_00485 [Leisingera caerulea]|uniref:KTSC domain-containing protein n=1 Tax=Leisingera caerulea TaxID=506591 RepID=A0ABY5WX88_LEICA|nr:hypothetical protein [Leisingera caerulea]UWQ58645.1 hypothetical protein K3722_00485 [Leisingera caerulea]
MLELKDVSIKELNFIRYDLGADRRWFTMTGYGRDYEIVEQLSSSLPKFQLTKNLNDPVKFVSHEGSFEAAKARAQKDFEKHILDVFRVE